MSESSKKQSFLHGTALLAMATAIVKIIGALYKIPLNGIIGEQGFGYFSTAYDIYSVLLMISTAGLPVAMSRMISESNSLGNYGQIRRIYTTCRAIFFGLGLAGTLLMTLFCHQLAEFQEQPDAWAAIGSLGPASLLVCLMSSYRGFFQGQSNMIPTSVSQVLEALCKLFIGLAAAYALLKYTQSVPLAAGGAILGVTSGCLVGLGYLAVRFRRAYRELPADSGPVESYGMTTRKLLAIAVPITIGSAGLQIITMMEIKVYMSQLMSTGFTQGQADTMKGIYNMAQTIFNMPCAFITPITISAIPAITASLTLKQHKAVRATEESASRITAILSMPCAIGLLVLSEPIMALLGGYTGDNLVLASRLMAVLGICVIFNATVLLTNAIMQAHGHANRPVINMFIGGAVKLTIIYVLTGNPRINIVGTPIGTVFCYACITALNLIAMRQVITDPPALLKNMCRPLLAAAIMGCTGYGLWRILGSFLSADSRLNRLLLCAVPILVSGVVYLMCVVFLKAFTREDCMLLPKGEKIANFLHL